MGNTRPSRTCVTQKYRLYTMGVVNTMITCLYQESLSIQWVHVYIMGPCQYNNYTMSLSQYQYQYHESMSIQ